MQKYSQLKQNGFVLIVSLIFLIIMTGLVITSIRRSTLDEKSASNMQSQNVAFQAAERALRFCESVLELDQSKGDDFCKKKTGLAGVLATVVIGASEDEPSSCAAKQADGNNPQANFPDCSEQKTNWSGANALAVTIAANKTDPNYVPNVAAQPQCMVEEWRFSNDVNGKAQKPAFVVTARAVGSTNSAVVWLQETIRCGKDGT